MDQTVVISLVKEVVTLDALHQETNQFVYREVYAQVRSITQTEWFEAGRNGLKPDIAFRISKFDYDDERLIEWDSKAYRVYRVFSGRNDIIELYCERKSGADFSQK